MLMTDMIEQAEQLAPQIHNHSASGYERDYDTLADHMRNKVHKWTISNQMGSMDASTTYNFKADNIRFH